MRRVREAIVVEGRYDKNTLSQVVDAVILETAGFGVFKDQERRNSAGLSYSPTLMGRASLSGIFSREPFPRNRSSMPISPTSAARSGASAPPARRGSWGWRVCPLSCCWKR